MKYADLHVHTYYSDSTFSPEEVLSVAKEKALSAIAICDHDTTDGVEPCKEIGDEVGIEILSGIELTVEKPDAEIHILGYLIDWKLPWLQQRLRKIKDGRIDRIYKMLERLDAKGVKIDAERVFDIAGRGSVGRLHLARAILNSGSARTLREVFERYIGFGRPCYVPNIKFEPKEAIEMVLEAGGVPVLAHPGIMAHDEYIPELVSYGLKGIEVYHTDHSNSTTKHYERLAASNKLVMTGGSDCHGEGKSRILMGEVRIPYDLVEKLKDKAREVRSNR
jgi:predicted metal-dependent phosphoesterase TrpH